MAKKRTCSKHCGKIVFFILWLLLWLAAIALLLWNVQWHLASLEEKIMAVVIVIGLGILLIDVMEGMAMAIMTILLMGRPRKERLGDSSRLTAILNYNLLAYCKKDIDDCYERMYQAFLGNLSENISAVLVSVTSGASLRRYELECRDRYRGFIYNTLLAEGKSYIKHETNDVEYVRLVNLWQTAEAKYGRRNLKSNLEKFCRKLSKEFMCIHRVSKVLRKCGQYQDLMLLSDGYMKTFTYCDTELYGPYARTEGSLMFFDTDDVRNIHKRKFDYTFVLDCDTRLEPGVAHSLLGVAVMKPGKGIIQPSIKFEVTIWDTIYMHLEDLRSQLNEPMANCMPRVLGQCGFFGKALLNNRIYIDSIIGHPKLLLEKIPVNVLSHDTYEAAILKPYFVASVPFIERPVYNYLAWNSRLRRWNLGDLILFMYFSSCFGAMIRGLQKCVQKKKFFHVKVRTPVKFGFVSSYISHTSIRGIFIKPFWCVFVIVYTACLGTKLYYRWIPIIVVLIIIIIFSKIPLLLRCSKAILYIIPELLSSMIQFTAEIIVGFVRIIRVSYALIKGKEVWVPQRFVEEEFDTVNVWKIWVYSWKHLWGYAVFGLLLIVLMICLAIFDIIIPLVYIMIIFDLATIAAIPMFCFITSLRICPCCRLRRTKTSSQASLAGDYSIFKYDNDRELLIHEDEKPRRKYVKKDDAYDMVDSYEKDIQGLKIINGGQRRMTERTGVENEYEEVVVPIDKMGHQTTVYEVVQGDGDYEFQNSKKSKHTQMEVDTYEYITSQREKNNPIFADDLAFENDYQLLEQPTYERTVYMVNETPRTTKEPKVYIDSGKDVYEVLETPEKNRKEAELREVFITLDSAIDGNRHEKRIKRDVGSTRIIKEDMMDTKPRVITTERRLIKSTSGHQIASGKEDSDFSSYISMQSPTRSSGYGSISPTTTSGRTVKSTVTVKNPSFDSEDSHTASHEIWSEKATTLSSMLSQNTNEQEKEESTFENMDVQTWLREMEGDSFQHRPTVEHNKTEIKEDSSFKYVTKSGPEVESYFERYGPKGNATEVMKTLKATYEKVPPKLQQDAQEKSRLEEQQETGYYEAVMSEKTPQRQMREDSFNFGKLDNRIMSEGTLIDNKLYENLAQWHKAMDKTMKHEQNGRMEETHQVRSEQVIKEQPLARTHVSQVTSSESFESKNAFRTPSPPPRPGGISYTTSRTFNIVPSKKTRDVRQDTIVEERDVTSDFSHTSFKAISESSSSSEDELWSRNHSNIVARSTVERAPEDRERSYTIVTERSVSPKYQNIDGVKSSRVHKTYVRERSVSPSYHNEKHDRYVSRDQDEAGYTVVTERVVASPRFYEVEEDEYDSIDRVESPRSHTKRYIRERSQSPIEERYIQVVERSVSPRRLENGKTVVTKRISRSPIRNVGDVVIEEIRRRGGDEYQIREARAVSPGSKIEHRERKIRRYTLEEDQDSSESEGKGKIVSAFSGLSKAPGNWIEKGKEKTKRASGAVKDKYKGAKYVVQEKKAAVIDELRGLAGHDRDESDQNEGKEDWMLKYEKRMSKKTSKVEKRSKKSLDKVGGALSNVKHSVSSGVSDAKELPGKAYAEVGDFGKQRMEGIHDII